MPTSKPLLPHPAVILAGGLGTRLRAAGLDCPKPMAPVAERPFLEWLILYLSALGIGDFILSVHHMAERIEGHFGAASPSGARIRCVREPRPLGTGGALAYAIGQAGLRTDFFAFNGDSIAPFPLGAMLAARSNGADGAILGVRVEDRGRYGALELDEKGLLRGFREKEAASGPALINVGAYLLNPALFPDAGENPIAAESLERETIPRWLSEGKRLAVVETPGPFIDIGAPESLAQATRFLQANPCFRVPAGEGENRN